MSLAPVFTPEDFVGDDALMIAAAEQFSRDRVVPLAESIDHQEPGLMPKLIAEAGELGLCGIDTSEAYGGLGLGKNIAARILEFMSLNGSFSVTYGITSGISQVGLSLFGTEDQKQRWLPKVASGEQIGAYCLSEPNSGSDALSATTRAETVVGGYRLTGTKMWISNAQWAEVFLVMAKVDGEHFTAFLVPRSAEGLTIEREEYKMGLKGSSTARVTLDNVFVPSEDVLHEVGKGHQVAFNALNIGRFKLASMSIGPARYAIELAAAYAKDRRQFGRPIAEFGLIREKFARMATLFWVAESAIYRTGAAIDAAFAETGGTIDGNRAAAEKYAIECAMVKVFSTEAEGQIVDEALQVYGGYGFTEEFPIARVYRDARVSRIYEGTNEINRLFIASRAQKRDAVYSRDTWFGRLTQAAVDLNPADQVGQGAVADLLTYAFLDQCACDRGERNVSTFGPLYDAWLAIATPLATAAASKLGIKAEAVPDRTNPNWDLIGEETIERGKPWRA
jgi:alkylation response protein AidB-like acyl-CoA dehydrogenase